MNYSSRELRGPKIFGSDRDDVFGDAGASAEISTSREGSGKSTTPETTPINTDVITTSDTSSIVRFKQRVFSFPATPPATPTKKISTEEDFSDLRTSFAALVLDSPEDGSHESYITSKETTRNGLGISNLHEEFLQQSTISEPSTPEVTPIFPSAKFCKELPLSPPKSPGTPSFSELFCKKRKAVQLSDEDEDVDNNPDLSENAKIGQISTPPPEISTTTVPTRYPLTPPLTPLFTLKFELKTLLHREEKVGASTKVVEKGFDSAHTTTPPPVAESNPYLAKLLTTLHKPKPTCTGCTTLQISTTLFTTLSTALSSNFEGTNHPSISLQIHPALLSHIIAFVPTNPITNLETKFFASLGSSHTSKSDYKEVDSATLHKYQAFRREEFQISCENNCGKHDRGYQIWRFGYVEDVYGGCGRIKESSARGIAEWRKGVLGRKLEYYSR